MDGLLVIDKPAGLTSHDVVARVRRLLGERRVGHTGTLDPMATGLLPIVVGRATRLARFLSAAIKRYEAAICLGTETDSYDATGATVGAPYEGPWPARELVERALALCRGTLLQQPPAFSAKKIDGKRSYRLARARSRTGAAVPALTPPALAAPVSVTAHAIDIVSMSGPIVTLTLECSAGFYVRSLAHDLGAHRGTGAHLAALRRTATSGLTLDDAIELERAEQDPNAAAARLVPLRRLLPDVPAVVLTPLGVRRAVNGCELGPADLLNEAGRPRVSGRPWETGDLFRLFDSEGELVGIGHPGKNSGLLHPSIVLV
jgi:tRNA pseudouridine55 synthase